MDKSVIQVKQLSLIKEKTFNSFLLFLIFTLILCILGGMVIYNATEWGPWAFSDSASYVSAAKNFSAGNGFVIINSNGIHTRVTEFPPFYPVFLSLFPGIDGNPTEILRWVNIALFVSFIAIFGNFLYYLTKNTFLSSLGMLICLTAPVTLEMFTGVISETLFLPLLFGNLLLANLYIQTKKKHIFILLLALSALLPITRYAGALFVGIITLLIFFGIKDDFKLRIRRTLIYAAISLLPLGLWFGKLYVLFNKVGGKNFKFGLDLIKSLFSSILSELNVIKGWLPYFGIYDNPLVDQILSLGGLFVFFAMIVIFIMNYSKNANKGVVNLFKTSVFCLTGYVLFIAFTHSITVPQIDIIDRMMVPLYPLLIGMIISSLAFLLKNKQRLVSILTIAGILIMLRFNFLTSSVLIQDLQEDGRGFSAREFQEAGIIEEIMNLPEDQKLISNSSAFVLYHINRFPLQVNQFTNMTYGEHSGYGEKTFREKDAALIIIYPHFNNFYGDSADELLANATNELTLVYQDDVSGIYKYPSEDNIIQP